MACILDYGSAGMCDFVFPISKIFGEKFKIVIERKETFKSDIHSESLFLTFTIMYKI